MVQEKGGIGSVNYNCFCADLVSKNGFRLYRDRRLSASPTNSSPYINGDEDLDIPKE